ncbi:MAG: helix-turn-helix transcriptional regulator [Actinomycetota bacterium]
MSRRGPRAVNERLRRLLVMLPWLMERGSVSTAEMADHFGLSVKDLVADLTLVSMCGISQDPRDLIDVWVDEDQVYFGLPKYFERPLRLTVPEAFSLVAAALAAEQMTGADDSGSLASAIRKVARAVGFDPNRDLAVELEAPESLEQLSRACAEHRVVEFDYWSVESGTSTRRRMAPVEVFGDGGHWYLRAFDLDVQREKTFRLDRLDGLTVTEIRHDVELGERGDWFSTADEVRRVTMLVDPSVLWMIEQYPTVDIVPNGDMVEVTMLVNGQRWLGRLLLRLGSKARVIDPQEWTAVGAQTADRVLEAYRRAT